MLDRFVSYTRNYVLNSHLARQVILRLISGGELPGMACPICGAQDCVSLDFHYEGQVIRKNRCRACEHIFSGNLNKNLEQASILFDYTGPSKHYEAQKYVIAEAMRFSRKTDGLFLDFGIGGNIDLLAEINREGGGNRLH